MIIYLLKSASCLALLLFFYHFILEREKMHNFNRFYLLGSVLFSFLVPFATITIPSVPEIIETVQYYSQPVFIENTTPIVIEETFNYTQLFIGAYILVSFIFLLRFGRNLFKIIKKISGNKKVQLQKATLVLVEDNILPHTFWNYIIINKKEYEQGNIEEELFTHELTHVTQRHTVDVLLIELLQIVFWINPLFIFLKKAIQLNHEFLADEKVINQHKNTFQYQHLLLNKAAWNNEYYLASNLNYSLTKKRLNMMTKQSSQKKVLLKKLAVIPLLAGFIFLFAERVEAQEKQEVIIEQPKNVQKNNKKLTEEQLYRDFTHQNSFITTEKNGKKISKKYNEMSRSERDNLRTFSRPIKTKKKVPTQKLIEDLKDKAKYAVWIDGKVVKNEVLNNYKASDFSNFFVSFVYKNARSKRFPQEHQASLYTNNYFKSENIKRAKAFEEYKKKHEVIEIIEEVKDKNEEALESDKKEYFGSPIFKNNSSKQSISSENKKFEDIRIKLREVDQSRIEFTDIENMSSFFDKTTTQKDSIKFHKNWFITIDGQKYFYTFDKSERVARYYKNGKLAKLDIVKEYKKKHQIFENLKASGKHYVFKPENEKKIIEREFSDLGGMYFRMPRVDKNKVPYPENPVKPYVRLRKGDKIWYKKFKELTEEEKLLLPPPPPVPNATEEEILKAKKAYEAWKKRIGNDLPPPPPPKSQEKELSEKEMAEYKVLFKTGEKYNIYKQKDFEKMVSLYLKMSKKQQSSVTDIRTVDIPPPPGLGIVFTYKILFNKGLKSKIYKVKDVNKMIALYKKMSKSQQNKVTDIREVIPPPPPPTKQKEMASSELNEKSIANTSNRKQIIILVSENGDYSISEDESLRKIKPISLKEIEGVIANLSTNEIKNTFVFTKSSDYTKFRSKPSNTKEYQNDFEINIIKSKFEFYSLKDKNGIVKKFPKVQLVLDNSNSNNYKEYVIKLTNIFKKYNVNNITI